MGKRIYVLIYLLCVGFAFRTAHILEAQAARKLADVVDSVRPSVVQVAIRLRLNAENRIPPVPPQFQACFGGGGYCIAGTGFFVNTNGDVVTAFHVVDGYRAPNGIDDPGVKQILEILAANNISCDLVIGVALPDMDDKDLGGIKVTIAAATQVFPADIGVTDPAHDLAIVKPRRNPFTQMPTLFAGTTGGPPPQTKVKAVVFSQTRPRDAEEIFACGYPFGEAGLVTTSGSVASAWNQRVLLRSQAAGYNSPIDVYNADLRINFGNSGGPVFRLSDQAVIGVSVEGLGSLGILVPSKYVVAFLKSQNIALSEVSPAPPKRSKSK